MRHANRDVSTQAVQRERPVDGRPTERSIGRDRDVRERRVAMQRQGPSGRRVATPQWVEARKDELYKGEARDIVAHLKRRIDQTPRTGPGNKGKRKRLEEVTAYIAKRLENLRNDRRLAQDLDLGTGADLQPIETRATKSG